ncbi:hypothetical protein NDU88_008498 [Pleurodeles waltl]|uniref:Uncharacterized protein n=1 Tax=Pleurodeles waltl TaxID=8319 RepID=A0AAV7PSA7_PLEWA|nr:hypothetical protein NDU88_008498 [Pleurodeles waltl]
MEENSSVVPWGPMTRRLITAPACSPTRVSITASSRSPSPPGASRLPGRCPAAPVPVRELMGSQAPPAPVPLRGGDSILSPLAPRIARSYRGMVPPSSAGAARFWARRPVSSATRHPQGPL